MAKNTEGFGFKEVLMGLKKGEISCFYVFDGDENYLKNKLVKAIETLLIEPTTKSLDYISNDYSNQSSKINILQLITDAKTPPFLSKRRVVVIKNSGLFTIGNKSKKENETDFEISQNNEDNQENDIQENTKHSKQAEGNTLKDKQSQLLNLFSNKIDSCCLIFIEDKVDKRLKALIEKIRENGIFANISKPDLRETRLWVKGEFAKSNISIAQDESDYFIDKHDGNLQSMVEEINKIVNYIKSKDKLIVEKTDIDDIGSSDLRGSIFDIVDALSKKDADEAYRLLDLLIIQKQPLPLISFMVARHFRQLIIAKELGTSDSIIKRMKVIPFVANKLIYQAKRFNFDDLEELYSQCFEMDLAVKTSNIQDRLALETIFANTINKISFDGLKKSYN